MTALDTRPIAGPDHSVDADPASRRRWWILAVLGIAQLMVVLDGTIVNIALPHAQASLGFSDSDRQWIITAYSLAFGSLLLLGGRLADLFGRKRLFLTGVIGFAAASALGGAATNFGMLVVARAIQGGFGALLAPAALSLVTTTFTHPKERGKAFGIYGGIAGAGGSIGLLLGGALTEYLDWRWTMYVNVFFAIVAAVGAIVLLAPHTAGEQRQRLDRIGAVLASASMFSIVYGFSHAASAGWGDSVTVGFLVVGVALLIAFVAAELRVAHPLLPMRIVTDRNRGGAYAAMFLASVGMFGVFLFLTYYLETTLGYSPVKTGLAFLPMMAAVMLSSSIANTVLLARYSPRVLVPTGLVISAVGMALLTRIDLHSSYASTILPSLLLFALGLGLVFAPSFSLGTLGVAAHDAGVASATVNVSQQIGGSIGTALLNTIATSAATGYVASHAVGVPSATVLASAAVHSYVVAFWVGAAVFLVTALIVGPLLRPGLANLAANEQFDELDAPVPVAMHV
ncbi:MAG TPA: DHA2 family efflux MFS transporter permease subunit [Jatrophihabitantaceae bacterium]|nr:DHA2 family efflux MFS transporter permease subunit [Jatrophihabitantaceae bacterium]